MTTRTYADIITPHPSDAILRDNVLPSLTAHGLSAQGWEPTRVARALAEIQADQSAVAEALISDILAGGSLDTAPGAWLDVLAWGFFRELRTQALQSIVQLRLTDSAGAGPYRLTRPIAVAYPSTVAPLYYRAQAGTVEVPRNGYVDAAFVAESAGARYNVAAGQITGLSTPAPGVTVTSPALDTGTILIQVGADVGTDPALRAQCSDKWGMLAQGYVAAKLRAIARLWEPTLTRFLVLDPGGLPGIADMYLATSLAPATHDQAVSVYRALLDPARKPAGSYPVRVYPAELATLPMLVKLYGDGTASAAQVQADAAFRLAGYQSTLDIGQRIHVSRLIDVLVDVDTGAIGAVLEPNGTPLGVTVDGPANEFINPGPYGALVFQPAWQVV